MSLRVPDKASGRYDVLDTLRDGRGWSCAELREDTGRTFSSIDCLGTRLLRDQLITWTLDPSKPRRHSYMRITDKGMRWLFWVDHGLPGQVDDLLTMFLELVADGPVVTNEVKSYRRGRVRNAAQSLIKRGYLDIEHQRTGIGGSGPSRLTITDKGRDLLRSMRGLPCFETSTKTFCRAGSTP